MQHQNKVILVTGSSTGIGRATVRRFSREGWNVVATLRNPEGDTELANLPGVTVVRLDVTDQASSDAAVATTVRQYGRIDVVLNNAGYGLTGPFEDTDDRQIRRQFDTNVFGLMAVCRAVLPVMREQRSGRILNVSSVGGRMTFPLYSSYHATKWAVEGFTESLQFELTPFGIDAALIEPGAIKTDFYDRSADRPAARETSAYGAFKSQLAPHYDAAARRAVSPDRVAAVILRAATAAKPKLRYAAAGGASLMLLMRRLLPEAAFIGLLRARFAA